MAGLFRQGVVRVAMGIALIALAGSSSPSAMVVVPVEFGAMVAASPTVVHGRVVSVQAYETAGRRTIESLVTVEVVEVIKGEASSTAYFKVPGGQVGRYRRVMVGAPTFTRGDEVVLFLEGRAPAVPLPFGLTQGVYRVTRDGGGKATVTPLVPDAAGRVVRGDPARRPLELQAFIGIVRTAARPRP